MVGSVGSSGTGGATKLQEMDETPELEALRVEIVNDVYTMGMEKRRKVGVQIELCYGKAENEEETEGQEKDRKKV